MCISDDIYICSKCNPKAVAQGCSLKKLFVKALQILKKAPAP